LGEMDEKREVLRKGSKIKHRLIENETHACFFEKKLGRKQLDTICFKHMTAGRKLRRHPKSNDCLKGGFNELKEELNMEFKQHTNKGKNVRLFFRIRLTLAVTITLEVVDLQRACGLRQLDR
jgi:hypothetical protein